jgi:histidine triad (HIT) family protein
MATTTDCLFCKLIKGEIPAAITYRDDDVVAFRDIKPHAPLHELVIPTRHIASLAEAVPEDAALLGKLMLVGAQRARDGGFRDGFRVVHAHLHVLSGRPLTWPPG